MRRRDVLAGALAAWASAGATAQAQGVPVIGFLGSETPEQWKARIDAFTAGLREMGFAEGRNVRIEYRWAGGRNERLAGLAAELVRSGVTIIVVLGNTTSAIEARKATSTIPIVVRTAVDPASIGLVETLGRPGGNLTGWTTLGAQMGPKQLELLRDVLPAGAVVGVLVNPTNPLLADLVSREVPVAAAALGLEALVLRANSDAGLDSAFAELSARGGKALIIGADTFFNSRNDRIATLALQNKVIAVSAYREFTHAGGLMSYGGSVAEASRRVGEYVGRILKGEKPGELPVQQVAKLELILNLKTAALLGLSLPVSLVGRADEVIE
ncbi:ABC transporter substrate-binding protein [Alsobacter sp. R-9]